MHDMLCFQTRKTLAVLDTKENQNKEAMYLFEVPLLCPRNNRETFWFLDTEKYR